MLIGSQEGLELGRSQRLLTILCINSLQVVVLGIIDTLVVDLGQRIQLGTQLLELSRLLLILELADCLQMQILRMECEGRIGIVGVGILPRAGHRRIIDRQNLNDRLPRSSGPIHHLLQIIELTHTKALLRTQREDRNRYTGTTPRGQVKLRTQRVDHRDPLAENRLMEVVILPLLPSDHLARSCIDNHKFEAERAIEARGLDRSTPHRSRSIAHHHTTSHVPVAQHLLIAHQHYLLRRTHHRYFGTNHHLTGSSNLALLALRACKHTFGKHGRSERAIGRHSMPTVVDHTLGLIGRHGQRVGSTPFAAQQVLLVVQLVMIAKLGHLLEVHLALPNLAPYIVHGVAFESSSLLHHQDEVLAIVGAIGHTKTDSHHCRLFIKLYVVSRKTFIHTNISN